MRKLTTEHRAQLLISLVEGNSIASTCRMFGVNKITVLRLLADAGTFAADFHDAKVRNLATERVQMDEIWSYVHSKARNVQPKNWGKGHGDAWCWVAMDADCKLAINWHVGGRDAGSGRAFVADTADRLASRVQITSDGWNVYAEAIQRALAMRSITPCSSKSMPPMPT